MAHANLQGSMDRTIHRHVLSGAPSEKISARTCEICGRNDPSVICDTRVAVPLCETCRLTVARMPQFTRGLIHRFLIGNVC